MPDENDRAIPSLARELGLEPHPEGGWYRRTWTSPETVALPDGRVRPTATAILFHLPAGQSSAWHRVRSAEVWCAHTGAVVLEMGGSGERPGPATASATVCGDPAEGVPQVVVPAGTWQRTRPSADDALVTCVVSPGFDFADFELA